MLSKDTKIKLINLRLKIEKTLIQNKRTVIILCVVCMLTLLNFTKTERVNSDENGSIIIPTNESNHKIPKINNIDKCGQTTSFLVIGDWGIVTKSNPDYSNKLKIGRAMKQIHDKFNTSFVISLGDQHYDHGIHLNHPLDELSISNPNSVDLKYWFIDHFENAYHESLKPWYLILGNHDMRGSVKAQFKYSNISDRWNMPYNYYYKDFPIQSTFIYNKYRVIFIDTSSIMCYHEDRHRLDALESWNCDETWFHRNDGRKSKYNEKDEDKFIERSIQIEWIKERIIEADMDTKIRWIFIAGHHCLWSNGPHGCPKMMGKHLRPLFMISPKIKGYFCGHNHGLEHFKWSKDYVYDSIGDKRDRKFEVHTFLSGGGACLHEEDRFYKRCKFDELVDSEDETNEVIEPKYVGITRGFMSVHVDGCNDDNIDVKYWDQDAKLLYASSV